METKYNSPLFLGNAFRSAYAHQLHDQNNSDVTMRPGSSLGFHSRPHLSQSRSADSLLSPDVINEDQGKLWF